ncbi:probable multidrug resistance-associated protein lethal(2)03659 [Anoplophora glabripennis]|uniref:probable multidrug resistance-associated protein lethal(2)03659 n=1 Tax=Anoplophora glabripennis TaxID=217634 RepID=UPI000873DB79|nr:probable multidrug resistance-associated protein lethal(2)03659 [Anoplophora glabripennis]
MEEIKYSAENFNKRKHPLHKANIVTKTFFCWLLPFFVRGFKKELTEDDMYGTLKSHDSGLLGDRLQKAWNHEVANKKDPSLWIAILKVFGIELLLCALYFGFIEFVIKLSQPILISKLLTFYEPNQTAMSKDEACIYGALLVLFTLLRVVLTHNYLLQTLQLSMKIRVATCSLIYRKSLKLSKFALIETTIGQMVNLLSNDVSRFNTATQYANYLWLSPLGTALVMYLLYINVGITGLAGTFFLLLFIPFQVYMGKKTSQFRLRTALRTDERVRLMSEIVTGIQVIKMYTWEKPFAKLVELSREKEMQQIWSNEIIKGIAMSFNLVLNRAAVCICILTYVLSGNVVNATYAYTVSSYYATLRQVVVKFFPEAVTQLAETKVSVSRIRTFLMYEEIEVNFDFNVAADNKRSKLQNGGMNSSLKTSYPNQPVGIQLNKVSVKWIKSLPDNALENITFDVNSKQLVTIIGPVGGGKTTLLNTILKELPPVEGTVNIRGSISYASQEPWLFGGSVRQNIIFGQKFNAAKYDEVVKVCALERDFTLFPYGDQTLVGDRGTTLSGGQRARINLARAVYKEADIYLLDDPLSAVDTHVGRQLFDQCICGYLKDKCVVLVTHQIQYLKNVETIYLIDTGKIYVSGSYLDLQSCDNEFIKLLTNSDKEKEDDEQSPSIEKKFKLVNAGNQNNTTREAPIQQKEFKRTGDISWCVYKNYFVSGGSWIKILLLLSTFIISQVAASTTDYFVSVWVNLEQWRVTQYKTVLNNTFSENSQGRSKQDLFQSTLDLILTKNISVVIYTCLIIGTITVTLTRSISFFKYCSVASTKLHNLMFDKIVYAPMRFFNLNPPGRILNRFSKDIGAVDELLPLSLLDTLETGLNVAAISLVIGSLNPWILLPTLVILVIFYYLRVVFLATSRAVKRIEATTRSPIYTHLSASLQGLTTIRAFGAQNILKKEFDNYQNRNTSPCYMFIATNRTFGFWLDFHCVIYIALVTVSILFIEKEVFGGNVGLALTQSISLTGMFQWGVRQWSELENNMTSVERVQEYTEVTPEKDETTKPFLKFWPEEGTIEFIKMCLRYSPDDSYVLRDLTFEIKSNEKIGIVGRTGAGKSSLIAALFRLTDIEGSIVIDKVDTRDVPLNTLRSKISIIPQEPVLFSGTLRKNLDPFDEYSDEILWNALEEVELKNAISSLAGGLDSKMSEGGSNFSVGQRQLMCLARTIIRNNRILVLDEATANVDPHTDGLIQTTIRKKFANCTVLTIAHRLHTIMDSDKVLVMDAGRAVEFDHPYNLLKDPDSVFYGLVMQTGARMAENLISVAEQSYRKLPH